MTTASEPGPDQLAELPEDWGSALCVVAHPDDMEYGTAAAVARWTGQGKTVRYLLATKGEAGIDGIPPAEAGPLRVREQQAACDAVGVAGLEFLDHQDGVVHDLMRLRKEIAGAIRRHRPDVVVTINHREFFGRGMYNMADHRVVGLATLDAVRDAANRWVFTDLADDVGEVLEPWGGVRFTAIAASPAATHAVDVSQHLEAGTASLAAHELYLEGLGEPKQDPAELAAMFAGSGAEKFGSRPCATFEVIGL